MKITLESILRDMLGFTAQQISKNKEKIEIAEADFQLLISKASGPQPQGELEKQLMELQPLLALDELEDGAPTPSVIIDAIKHGKWRRQAMILMPSMGDISSRVTFAIAALLRQHKWLGYTSVSDTIIQRARNLCVHEFLKTEATVSVWMDSDTIPPLKMKGFFAGQLNIPKRSLMPVSGIDWSAIDGLMRLLSHKKTIVGATYRQRKTGGILVIQPALHPRSTEDKRLVEELEEGPLDRLVEVGYVATGFAVVHRSVYEDIMKSSPELMGKDGVFDFFGHDVSKEGEDIAFCKLAAKAGHKSHLDCLVRCAHIGRQAFI